MDGTPEQKEQWLPGIASGDIIASFALTEPDNGSDAEGFVPRHVGMATSS